MSESHELYDMLEQRNEALGKCLREVDYLISYGMIREARENIANAQGADYDSSPIKGEPDSG